MQERVKSIRLLKKIRRIQRRESLILSIREIEALSEKLFRPAPLSKSKFKTKYKSLRAQKNIEPLLYNLSVIILYIS